MGSSSDRLPSFKGPRDLSLSSRSAKRDVPSSVQPRPKRVFTPNIPPKRDRTTPSTLSNPPTSSSPSTQPHEASKGPGPSSRGRSPRGRGGPRGGGARGAKQRGELVQSESIFSEGIGDPVEAKRSASMQYKSGYGGSRYRSGADGGASRISSLNRTTLHTIIKEEDDSSRKLFGTEGTEEDEPNEEEMSHQNPHIPVILPLLYYTTENLPESSPQIPKTLEPVPSSSTAGIPTETALLEVAPIPTVRIKQETGDDVTTVSIKEETFDALKTSEISQNLLKSLKLEDSTTFAKTFRDTPKTGNGTLVYFQLPDELPVLEGSLRENVDQQGTKSPEELVHDINDFPEGLIGRLQILSNGKTRFVIGENSFDVDAGRPIGFRQELYYLSQSDDEEKVLSKLGSVNRKFVLTPDIERILTGSL